MTCSSGRLAERKGGVVRALSIGPAASLALSAGAGTLRVHSVFPSTVNLLAGGGQRLVSLCGPRGGSFPHAVVLERPEDLDGWRLSAGTPVRLAGGALRLPAADRTVWVDLTQAERSPARALPAIPRLGKPHRACADRLAELQRQAGCDLRIDALRRAGQATTPLGATLRDGALALGAAAGALARSGRRDLPAGGRSAGGAGDPRAALQQAAAALVGLGAGLTPSGDDFLCGFLAAARAAGPEPRQASLGHGARLGGRADLVGALKDAAGSNLGRTGLLSALLVRGAIQGFWPTPLVDLAEALAQGREAGSLAALGALCRLGHSSGADLATGFLFGLESMQPSRLARPSARSAR